MTGTRAGSGDRLWKVVVGCGLAFGLVLLVGICVALYGVYWALSPGRQMPTVLAVGPRSVGVVRLERGDTDRGMQELVEAAVRALQRAQLSSEDRNLPPFVQSMRRWQLAQSGGNLGIWIPREATLSIEAGAESERDVVVAAVNWRGLVRPMGKLIEHMMSRDPKARVVTHGGHDVVVSPGGSAVGFAEGTVLFGSGASDVTAVLDRWVKGPSAPPAPPLPASIQDLSGRFDVYGALQRPSDARALLGVALALAGPDGSDATAGLESARFGLDAATADEARSLLELSYETAAATEAARGHLQAVLSGLQERTRARGAAMEVDYAVTGPRLAIEVRVTRLESAIHDWAAELMRRQEE